MALLGPCRMMNPEFLSCVQAEWGVVVDISLVGW